MTGTPNVPVKGTGNHSPTIARKQSQSPFDALHRQVNQLFDAFGYNGWPSSFGSTSFGLEPGWLTETATVPAVDIVEKDNAYEITADLPGIDEKNIEVQLNNGRLTIRGEKAEEKQEKKKDYFLQERHVGSFERSFAIPEAVDGDKISATFNRGVLTVSLPKKPEAKNQVKKIDVRTA